MKLLLSLLAAAVVMAMVQGCIPGLKGSRNPSSGQDLKAQSVPGQNNSMSPKNPVPPLADGKIPNPGTATIKEDPLNSRLKDEINDSALKFAKNIPNVKHVKTCYSHMYGEWNLYLYVPRGKKISYQQFLWNKESQEWETVYGKGLTPSQVEFHLKGEVGDEKCFILK